VVRGEWEESEGLGRGGLGSGELGDGRGNGDGLDEIVGVWGCCK